MFVPYVGVPAPICTTLHHDPLISVYCVSLHLRYSSNTVGKRLFKWKGGKNMENGGSKCNRNKKWNSPSLHQHSWFAIKVTPLGSAKPSLRMVFVRLPVPPTTAVPLFLSKNQNKLTEPVDKHLTVTVTQVAPELRFPLLSVPLPSSFIPYFPPFRDPGLHVPQPESGI